MLELIAACAVTGICVLVVPTVPRLRRSVTGQILRAVTPTTIVPGAALGITSLLLGALISWLVPWTTENHGLLDASDATKNGPFFWYLASFLILTVTFPRPVLESEHQRYRLPREDFIRSVRATVVISATSALIFTFVLSVPLVVVIVFCCQWALSRVFAPSITRSRDVTTVPAARPTSPQGRRSPGLAAKLAELPTPWRVGALQCAATLVVSSWLALTGGCLVLYLANS